MAQNAGIYGSTEVSAKKLLKRTILPNTQANATHSYDREAQSIYDGYPKHPEKSENCHRSKKGTLSDLFVF
jgi:hypothetical protein